MAISDWVDGSPVLVAIAGSYGAGKTTFFHAHLRDAGLRFVNADDLGQDLGLSAYEAASVADALRRELIKQRESFIFETVFSDPAGDKLALLNDAAEAGYTVVLCFIGIPDSETSEQRVAMRVSQGGHDVPTEKLVARFPRTLANLKRAIEVLPTVLVFDNSDMARPFRKVAEFRDGKAVAVSPPPEWLRLLLEDS